MAIKRKKKNGSAGSPKTSDTLFGKFARTVADASGHPAAFIGAACLVIVWGISGPIFDYSETWQLVINTGTTIITFLMVFVIQNTQNKDTEAMQLKLDELLRANDRAHNALMCLEDLSQEEMDKIKGRFVELAHDALDDLRDGTVSAEKPGADELFDIAKPSTNIKTKKKD